MQRLATRVRVDELPEEEGANLALTACWPARQHPHPHRRPKRTPNSGPPPHQELGGLPLALDQAGAYLEATGMDLTTYHQIYQKQQIVLLAERRSLVPDHPRV